MVQPKESREGAARRTKRYAGYSVDAALEREHQRKRPLKPVRYPRYSDPQSKRQLLLVPGLGTNSEDQTLVPLASEAPNYSRCDFSYGGIEKPVYGETLSTIVALLNITATTALLDAYLPLDGARRLIAAHSFGGVLAYQWMWKNRGRLKRSDTKISLLMIGSPVFVSWPRESLAIPCHDNQGRRMSLLVDGLTYPPNRVAKGVRVIASCFCEGDVLALPAVCRIPQRKNTRNRELKHKGHSEMCHSALCIDPKTRVEMRRCAR